MGHRSKFFTESEILQRAPNPISETGNWEMIRGDGVLQGTSELI